MLCTRCIRSAAQAAPLLNMSARPLQSSRQVTSRISPLRPGQRSFSILSQPSLRRPTLPARVQLLESTSTTTSLSQQLPSPSPSSSLLDSFAPGAHGPTTLIRGAKRDTFRPSHVVRKRRHGYLSRIRTRNGRRTLLRRKLKGRMTLSH